MSQHKKRIDFLTAEYSNVPAAQFVRAVNDCYYQRCAGNYDATPDIAYDAVHAWQRIGEFLAEALPGINNYSLVDIGSGTGFVAERVIAGLLPVAKYVGFEPSDDMRQVGQAKHHDPRITFLPLDVSCKISETISAITGPKIVTMNSVLHHIVWWEDFLVDVVGCLNPGDLFVICHEPNSRFWENSRLVQVFDAIVEENRTSRPLAKYLNPLNYVRKLQKACGMETSKSQSLIDLINRELVGNGVLHIDLQPEMIGAIIDYGVPLCWRNITCDKTCDEGFLNIERLKNEFFQECEILHSFTYQHLAFSPSIVSDKWKKIDSKMARELPDDGAQFCIIIKKDNLHARSNIKFDSMY